MREQIDSSSITDEKRIKADPNVKRKKKAKKQKSKKDKAIMIRLFAALCSSISAAISICVLFVLVDYDHVSEATMPINITSNFTDAFEDWSTLPLVDIKV